MTCIHTKALSFNRWRTKITVSPWEQWDLRFRLDSFTQKIMKRRSSVFIVTSATKDDSSWANLINMREWWVGERETWEFATKNGRWDEPTSIRTFSSDHVLVFIKWLRSWPTWGGNLTSHPLLIRLNFLTTLLLPLLHVLLCYTQKSTVGKVEFSSSTYLYSSLRYISPHGDL